MRAQCFMGIASHSPCRKNIIVSILQRRKPRHRVVKPRGAGSLTPEPAQGTAGCAASTAAGFSATSLVFPCWCLWR